MSNTKYSIGLAVLAVIAVGVGGYMIGASSSGGKGGEASSSQTATPTGSSATAVSATNQPPQRPHPPIDPVTSAEEAHTAVKYTHYRVGNSNVKSMFSDGDTMWVGTSGGVIRYDISTDKTRIYDVRSGLLSNGVFYLGRIDDRLAVGTYGGGLSLLDTKTDGWDNYNIQHGLGDAFVYDVLQASNGDVWIATWSGANRVRNAKFDDRSMWDTFTVANTGGGLPNDWVYGLREGVNGEIWMATEGGLARYVDGKWDNWQHDDGLGAPYEEVRDQIEYKRDPSKESSHHARQKVEQGLTGVDIAYNPNYIVSLEIDTDGSVWAGTWGGGLAHFDGKNWSYFTVDDGLPSNHVFMLKRDPQGRFWVGTGKGLALFDGKKFETFTTRDGLFADNVFSAALTDGGDLWVGSFGGVARFDGVPAR